MKSQDEATIAELRGALHQLSQRSAHGGKCLIEIRGHIRDARPFRRLAGQAEGGARLINTFQRLCDLRVRDIECFAFLVEILRTRHFGREEALRALKFRLCEHLRCLGLFPGGRARANQRHLIVHVLNRVREFEAQAARRAHFTAHRRFGNGEIRLCGIDRSLLDRDLHAIGFRVEPDEHITLLHSIVIVDQDTRHLADDARCNEGHVAVHIGIIGRNGVPRMDDSRNDDKRAERAHPPRLEYCASDDSWVGKAGRISAARSRAEVERLEPVSILRST